MRRRTMDFLLRRPVTAELGEEEHGEMAGRAEMPLRFEFHAGRLWLGKSLGR